MSELNINDYKKILNYYKLSIPKSNKIIKSKALSIISNKLCKCIKKINKKKFSKKSENIPIKICTKSVIRNKGLSRGNFTCKKKRGIILKKEKYLFSKNKTIKSNRKYIK
jgi:hypothetical protein